MTTCRTIVSVHAQRVGHCCVLGTSVPQYRFEYIKDIRGSSQKTGVSGPFLTKNMYKFKSSTNHAPGAPRLASSTSHLTLASKDQLHLDLSTLSFFFQLFLPNFEAIRGCAYTACFLHALHEDIPTLRVRACIQPIKSTYI